MKPRPSSIGALLFIAYFTGCAHQSDPWREGMASEKLHALIASVEKLPASADGHQTRYYVAIAPSPTARHRIREFTTDKGQLYYELLYSPEHLFGADTAVVTAIRLDANRTFHGALMERWVWDGQHWYSLGDHSAVPE